MIGRRLLTPAPDLLGHLSDDALRSLGFLSRDWTREPTVGWRQDLLMLVIVFRDNWISADMARRSALASFV